MKDAVATIARLPKYSPLKDFLHCLTSDDITHRQKKALLVNASKLQRLGLIEIALNVTYGNIELGEERLAQLRKYRLGLRRICSRGSSATNELLASNLSALVLVLRIALDHRIAVPSSNNKKTLDPVKSAVLAGEEKGPGGEKIDLEPVDVPSGSLKD